MVSVGRIQDHECNIPLIPYDKPMMQIHSELRKIKHMISGAESLLVFIAKPTGPTYKANPQHSCQTEIVLQLSVVALRIRGRAEYVLELLWT